MLSFASLHYAPIDCVSLVIVALGILVQARVGIGFALISAPILFLINPAFMPGPILILGFVLSLLLFLSEKQALSLALVLPAVIARLPGSWVAVLVLAYLPQWLLSLMIGLSLLCASFFSLMKVSITLNRFNLFCAGFISGFTGTITSIGGPVMALMYQNQAPLKARQALISFFLIGTPISIILLILSGSMSQEAYILSIKMLPGVLIGFLCSRYHRFASILPSKKVLILLSSISALVIIFKSII
jgi:uncharacterized membrane protein YfcA